MSCYPVIQRQTLFYDYHSENIHYVTQEDIILIYTPPLECGLLVRFFSRRLKVVLKGGWEPGAHFTIEKTFTVLDVTQTDRVHVHAEPGMQLYPFVGKF